MTQKGFTPIIFLIVVAILVVAGYFAYTKGFINQLTGRNINQSFISPKPYPLNTYTPIPSDSTYYWKDYTENTTGLSFKIPYSWEEVPNNYYILQFKTEYGGIFVISENDFQTDERDCFDKVDLENYVIGDKTIIRSAIQYFGGGPNCNIHTQPYARVEIAKLTSNNMNYYVYYGEPVSMWDSFDNMEFFSFSELITKKFEKILSTFKFNQ